MPSTPTNLSNCDNHTLEQQQQQQPPYKFCCPLTLELMEDPVLTKYGHSYERAAIMSWLRASKGVCPLTRQSLSVEDLVTHSKLQQEIKEWTLLQPQHCCYQEEEDQASHRDEKMDSASPLLVLEDSALPTIIHNNDNSTSMVGVVTMPLPCRPFLLSQQQQQQKKLMQEHMGMDDLRELLAGNISLATSAYRNSQQHRRYRRRQEVSVRAS